jgi:hypothetical protein
MLQSARPAPGSEITIVRRRGVPMADYLPSIGIGRRSRIVQGDYFLNAFRAIVANIFSMVLFLSHDARPAQCAEFASSLADSWPTVQFMFADIPFRYFVHSTFSISALSASHTLGRYSVISAIAERATRIYLPVAANEAMVVTPRRPHHVMPIAAYSMSMTDILSRRNICRCAQSCSNRHAVTHIRQLVARCAEVTLAAHYWFVDRSFSALALGVIVSDGAFV